MTLFRGKKGVDAFSLVLTIMAIMSLTLILTGLTINYNRLHNVIPGAGSNAATILAGYERGDSILLYIDNAARLSVEDSAFTVAGRGFFSIDGSRYGSSASGSHLLWSKGTASRVSDFECVASLDYSLRPSGYIVFGDYVRLKLNSYVTSYNSEAGASIPPNNYRSLDIMNVDSKTQVVGFAVDPIVVSSKKLEYKIKPSFREDIDVDIVDDFSEISENVVAILKENDGMLDSSIVRDKVESFNSDENPKVWAVDFESDCSVQCRFGLDCEIPREECTPVEKKKCETDDDTGEETCKDVVEDECVTVYDPGYLAHSYCSNTALISVRVNDERYVTEENQEGYKQLLTSSGVKPLEYRVGLNWVEMGGVSCFPLE